MKMYYLNRIYKLDPNTQELDCFCALEFQDVELNSSYIFKGQAYPLASCS